MSRLIIGHRGFVGSNLSRIIPDTLGAGRAEIASLAGTVFRDIYCAAPQAKKWWANQNPHLDREEVDSLIKACSQISCTGHFILLSTVDVYDPPTGKTEKDLPGSDIHPYGANRLYLEQFILEHFGPRAIVIRLPALVGHGLRKNIVFDLLNNNNVEQIRAKSRFQWFSLDFLGEVLDIAKNFDDFPRILNIATEPLSTEDLVQAWFPQDLERLNWLAPSISYDIRTVHGKLYKPYLYTREDVLERHLRPFIESALQSNEYI